MYNLKLIMTYYIDMLCRNMYMYLSTWVRYMDRITNMDMPIYIYKVLAFNEDVRGERLDLTNYFFEGQNYYNLISFSNYRIEYRYKLNNVKYRYVSDSNDDTFIPMKNIFHKIPFKKKIKWASLADNYEANRTIDEDDIDDYETTTKLYKYAGPNKDFYGRKYKLYWFFSSEDFQPGQELTIFDSKGEIRVHDMTNENLLEVL